MVEKSQFNFHYSCKYILILSTYSSLERRTPTLGVTQSLRNGVLVLNTHFVQAEMSPLQ